MKKLLLPVYKKENTPKASHPYYILFDIGQRLEFTNKRKAEDYVRKISSYIVDNIRVINTLQKELYSVYLENYFKLNERQCLNVHQTLDAYLERLKFFHSYQSRGDACIKFSAVYTLLNLVQDSAQHLIRALKKLKDYNSVSRLNGYLQVLTIIYQKLSDLKKGDISTIYKESSLKLVHKKKGSVSMT
ncbi:hypothetical protein [Tenacibaculum ovolyticum]|uniref:hypothetical protein n=1 Tax=Tenacibaculum ovolyticum TaxID=104270 RepID=UPI001F222274|nr:hypothetical protein [Tenacibaculum ovolyticum]